MWHALRSLMWLIGFLVLLVVIVLGGTVVALNTAAGRHFAEHEINAFAGPRIKIAGLAGHFPADIKLGSLSVADAQGVWLSGSDLELRWNPRRLLRREVAVSLLRAAVLDVSRRPVAGASSSSSGSTLPKLRVDIAQVEVPALHIGAALAGEDVRLRLSGALHLPDLADLTNATMRLEATTPDGRAHYDVNAGITPKTVAMQLQVAEPPAGLLGHFAGPQVHAPLSLNVSLAGPRDDAELQFQMGLGAAEMQGAGTLGLDPDSPKADVVLSIPALAPFSAMAGQNVAGSTKLHLVIAQQKDGSSALALNGDIALTAAPYGVAKWVGPAGKFSLQANLQGQSVNIQKLEVSGAAFSAALSGNVAQSGVDLNTQITLPDVGAFAPGISGNLQEGGTVIGAPGDFAVSALLNGDITEGKIPSGPFSLLINAEHLPSNPVGTLSGSGALENAPLLLDAAFSRTSNGAATLKINNALWRSLNAQADLALAPGAEIPTGTATFKLGRLADFQAFSPIPLTGSVSGDFAHLGGEKFKLDLDAKNLVVVPALGAVNATVQANGPTAALAVRAQATIARVISAPAKIALAGLFNLDARSANITALSASWRQLDAVLQGPAQIYTQPAIAVRHLALGVSGGRIGLDGTLSPNLNATLNVQNLPASLAKMFVPSMDASGTLSATAQVSGSRTAPKGRITLDARGIKLHSGPAAALPAADFSGTATATGSSATIQTKLSAGPNIALTADGLVPLNASGPLNLHVTGRTDLRLLDPILATGGSVARGVVRADVTVTGNANAPRANGSVTLENGSVENIASGLNLTKISARVQASGPRIDLQNFRATAGKGSITGHGTVDLSGADIPIDFAINADNATPVSSDIVTEVLDAALTVKGALKGKMALGGTIKIKSANINIPKSLPPSVANLPIVNAGTPPPPPSTPPPPVALDLLVQAENEIFVRGDGLFAELGGHLRITGTAENPNPEGGFQLIRGNFSLAGTNLQFNQGDVSFNGNGFMPTLNLVATTVTTNNNTATLTVGGTAAKPTITLSSSPPLPSDEILAQLLFGQSTSNLTAFQAASLAAALAQLSGVGGGLNPLDRVRNALGLDQLSLAGSGTGPPSVQAGRYVAPGVYVGATQATNGQGTQASVEINLYRGLKLQTSTGTSSTGSGNASSVGLTYQFNY